MREFYSNLMFQMYCYLQKDTENHWKLGVALKELKRMNFKQEERYYLVQAGC